MLALRSVLVLALVACLPAAARSQDCLSGFVVAEETAPGSGVWNYRTTLTYDLGILQPDPSHINLFLGTLATCGCSCDPGIIAFESPAGASPGIDPATGLPGTVEYVGVFDCGGDPTMPELAGRSIKWETPGASRIEPVLAGTGWFAFLSRLPAGPNSSATAAIKFGKHVCSGTVTGALPACDCATSARAGTWGRLKMLFR